MSTRERLPAAERRQRLLDAAVIVFADRGYAASIGELAAAAGVTRTVLYHYFDSKEALYLAALEAESLGLLEHLTPVVRSGGEVGDRARATMGALLDYAADHPGAWRLLFEQRDADEPAVAIVRARVHRSTMQAAAALFAADMADASLLPTSERAAIMADMQLGAVVSAVRWWRAHPRTSRDTVLAAAHDLLWHGLDGLPSDLRNVGTVIDDREERRPLWASSLADESSHDYDAIFAEPDVTEAATPEPAVQPLPLLALAAVATFAVVMVLVVVAAGRGSLAFEKVPSFWGEVPMTCDTVSLERDGVTVELFGCRALEGFTLPPGEYHSPSSQWTSDVTGRDALVNDMIITPEGELRGWAAY